MKKVAITGGAATGKSAVCLILKEIANAFVISSDEIVHQLLSSNPAIIQRVIELLGPEIVVNREIDRKKVAEIVFTDETKLLALEAILHPAVKEEITKSYKTINHDKHFSLFVVEIPLLYEGNFEHLFDITIVVTTDETICRQRFQKCYPHLSADEYDRRMKRQMSPKEKKERADYVIHNQGDLQDLRKETISIFKNLRV